MLLGLDPVPNSLWPAAAHAADRARGGTAGELAAAAVSAHCRTVIGAVGESCVGVKLQLACFERLGTPGRAALGETVDAAHAAGLLVLADGKRGDIGISAASYAESLLGSTESQWGVVDGLGADAATVNPLLGGETVDPFVEVARRSGRGVFVLARTSNTGASDIQDRELVGGGTVSDRLAEMVGRLGLIGQSGVADVGAVVGATAPGHLERLRKLMPAAPILLPGVGAQGGRVEDLSAAFAPGRAGGIITASRSIVGAAAESERDHEVAAAAAAEALRSVAWEISGA